MNLADVTSKMVAGGSAGEAGRHELAADSANPAMHTLTTAASLINTPASQVRDNERHNIRAGAALLASYEKKVTGGSTPADPGQWYGAVARYSQSTGSAAARSFADAVFNDVRHGASATPGGQHVKLSADTAVKPKTSQVTALHLHGTQSDPQAQCPAQLDCAFAPANTANYQVSLSRWRVGRAGHAVQRFRGRPPAGASYGAEGTACHRWGPYPVFIAKQVV